MTDKTNINREALAKTAALIRPALSTQNYIPALQHIRFDGKFATAFNDISAISVRLEMEVERCVPGELLIRALGSFNAESVAFAEGKDGALTISSGRSKVKLPTLKLEDFPLEWPDTAAKEIELHPGIVKAIERCLLGVGNDPTHPEAMGVTLDSIDGLAVLFATDTFTMSRYSTKHKVKLPGDTPVILPTFFCEQIVALAKAYSEEEMVLLLRPDSLMVEFGKQAKLFSKTLVDKEPLDFPAMFKKHLKTDDLKKELVAIPDGFDSALSRALLVLQGEADRVTTVKLGKAAFTMESSSSMGDADDHLRFDGEIDFGAPDDIYLDPGMVARGAKACGLMGFMPKALVLADSEAQFVHLVAYCAK